MRFSDIGLSVRITFVVVVLVVSGGSLWIWAEDRRLHERYLNERRADLETALHVERVRLNQAMATLRQDVVFLANTPPVSGIARARAGDGVDPRDHDSYAKWEARLQEIFAAFLRAHPEYYQARYIGVAEEGRELVRVVSRADRVEVVARPALRTAAGRDFFKAGLGLRAGQVQLSEFLPDSEQGQSEKSRHPMLRAVTPVFDSGGHIFGMVALGRDVNALFAASARGVPPGVQGYVADQYGRYLFQPDAERRPTAGPEDRQTIINDFAVLKSMVEFNSRGYLPLHELDDGAYLAAERVFFDAGDPARFLLLAYHIPAQVVAAHAGIPWPNLANALLVMLLLISVLMLMLHRTFAPLRRITLAAGRIAAGNRQLRLQEEGKAEIGELADALNVMLDKLSESELIERENAFRKELIESLPGVFYMIDAQGRFLMWNRNFELALQCTAAELLSRHPRDLFDEDERDRIESCIRQAFESGVASVEAGLRAKDGTKTAYHFSGRRVLLEGEPVLVGMGLDISEQQESSRVARMLLRRNRALMDNSMEGIHILDLDGDVLDANEGFCRMLGYSREELDHLNVADWDKQFSRDELRARIREFIGKSDTFETVHRCKDGRLLDVEICATGVEIEGEGYLFASSRDITERKKMQAVQQRHHQVIETAMDGFWMTDAHGYLEEANEAYAKISGYTVQELVGMHISQLEAAEQKDDVSAHIDKIMAQGYDRFETRHRRKDGRVIDIEISTTYMHESEKFFVFCRNITQRKHVEQELRVAAATFETHDAILITDAQSNIIRVNHAFTEITGYRAEEVLGKNPRIMSSGKHDRAFYIKLWQQLLSAGSWSGEIWDRRKSGEIYPKWMTISAVRDEQGVTAQYVAIFSDITERKRAEEEIRTLAFYDPLTRLPNRRLFIERLRAALPASARRRDFGAVLFLDMDRFKLLNDTLGHDYGDMMLVEVADRIKSCVREMDTVARLGGDEFVVLIEELGSSEPDSSRKIATVAEKIREALAQPYLLNGHECFSSPSIGIALYRGNELPVETLIRRADLAMYQAKSGGRNAVSFFDPARQDHAHRHDDLVEDLRHALDRGELQLYYQVQVDNRQQPLGAEVLLRWQHPQRGMVMPDQFIPAAEESGLILDIGRWVLDQACAQLARWQADEPMRQMTLTVNISARQFVQPDFVGQVFALVERHGVDASRLKLELTESVISTGLNAAVEKMRALRGIGVDLSMDGFSTLYSSLSYLKRLSSEQIKIHRDVVQGITAEGGEVGLVQAIAELAKSLGLKVYAEGVETEMQFSLLKQHDCVTYQGYLFGRAVPLEELEILLRDRQSHTPR